jgi:ribosome-associated protein YbcJ (S4-like RNA binding protein)
MKKAVLIIVFVVFGTTAMIAQDKNQDRVQNQDRLMLVDGSVLQIRDRDQVRLRDKVTLNDGTVVNPDGTYQTRNRKQLKLRDGECLDMDGVKYRNEYQYRYKVQQENKGLSQEQAQKRNQNRVHYMMVDGELLQIRNQFQNRLQENLNLGNGITVNPDGTYLTRNRKQLKLKDGECLNMEGEMFKNSYQHRKMNMKKMGMKPKAHKKPKAKNKMNKKG